MVTGINESRTLTKHISCEFKCKFDGRKCNSHQKWNNEKCRCKYKKHHTCKKDDICNPATCSCKNGKYLAIIIDDSVITCDEIIETAKYIPTKIVLTNSTSTNFYILLTFLLITISLLIAVSIYCYLIKYRAKQKHLLPYHITNKSLIEILYQ